jgi:hypothetical protein
MTSRPSGHWSEDDYDVLSEGEVVGRIMKVIAAPEDTPWMWTLAYGQHRDRSPTHGYEGTRRPPWQLSPRAGGGSDKRVRPGERWQIRKSGPDGWQDRGQDRVC